MNTEILNREIETTEGRLQVEIPPLEHGHYNYEIRLNGNPITSGTLTVTKTTRLERLLAKLRSLKRKRKNEGRKEAMTATELKPIIKDAIFKNETIAVDDATYQGCIFKDCQLLFRGEEVHLVACILNNVSVVFDCDLETSYKIARSLMEIEGDGSLRERAKEWLLAHGQEI